MKKLISLVLLLSSCFAIDGIAKEVGFIDGSHEGVLNPVSIDSKISIELQKPETYRCQSLHVQKDAELEFKRSPSYKYGTLWVTIEASEDIIINGTLTASEGMAVSLISKSFVAEHANITSSNFKVKSEDIRIAASEICSKNLTLGTLAKTTTILFDQASKIINPYEIKFDAQDIYAHGEITGEYTNVYIDVGNFISIDNLKVACTSPKTIDVEDWDFYSDYIEGGYEWRNHCLCITFKDTDCNLGTLLEGGAAYEHCDSSFLSNIARLLGSTHVYIETNRKISINSPLISAEPLSEFKPWLILIAPYIEINADVKVNGLLLAQSSDCCPYDVHEGAVLNVLSGANLMVKSLALSVVNVIGEMKIPDTRYLVIYKSYYDLKIGSFAKLSKVWINESGISCCAIPDGFSFNECYVVDSKYSPLYEYAKKLEIEHSKIDTGLNLTNVAELDVDDSEIAIADLGNLKKLRSRDSTIKLPCDIDEETLAGIDIDIDTYKIYHSYLGRSIEDEHKLYKYARKLVIKNRTMPQTECLDLTNVKGLVLECSSVNIKSFANLNSIVRKCNSSIKCFGEIPEGFALDSYVIDGSHEDFKRLDLRSITMHDSSLNDDELYKYAKKLIIENTMMYEGDVIYLSPNTTELYLHLSSINISVAGNLNKVYRSSYSTINLVEAMPHGFMIDEYCIHSLSKSGQLYKYAKKLIIKNITMCEDDVIYLSPNTTELDVDSSNINISVAGNLNKVHRSSYSTIKLVEAMPHGFMINEYCIQGPFQLGRVVPCSSLNDELCKYARKLSLLRINMNEGECFTLPTKVQELIVLKSNIVISNIVNLREIQNNQSSITCIDGIPDGFKLSSYCVLLSEDRTNFSKVMQDPLIYVAQDLIFEYNRVPSNIVDFPEFEKPMMESLTFKNCNLNFKKVVAKAITFEESKIRGNYIALSNLTAKKTDFVLGKDNVFDETSIELIDSQVSLTSHIELPSIKAVNCDIDLKDFTMRTKSLFSSGAAAELTSSASPLEDCRFTKDKGKLELIHGLL